MRHRRRLLGGLVGLVAGVLLWPGLALAHATVVRSDPPNLCPDREQAYLVDPDPRCAGGQTLAQPPAQVTLLFSEPVQPVGGGIRVVGPSGRAVEQGPATLSGNKLSVGVEAGEPGTYLVTWRVVSDDTHPAWGRFAFSVGSPSATHNVDAATAATVTQAGLILQALGHWLHTAGYALAFGTLAFIVLVLGPAPAGAAVTGHLWRLVNAGMALLLLAEVPGLFGQQAGLGTGLFFDAELFTALLASRYGLVLAQRLGATLLLWVLLGVVGPGGGAGAQRWLGVALLPGLALAFIDGQASHALAMQPPWLGLEVHAIHIGAMGVWVGGLAALLVVWRAGEPGAPLARLVRRFGRIAGVALLLLAGSGLLMAGAHLDGVTDLLTTGYGRVLGAKLILLGLAITLAGVGTYGRVRYGGRWRVLEIGALAAVVLLAAVLVTLPPPR